MRKEEIRTGEKLLRVVEDDTSLNICIILGGSHHRRIAIFLYRPCCIYRWHLYGWRRIIRILSSAEQMTESSGRRHAKLGIDIVKHFER